MAQATPIAMIGLSALGTANSIAGAQSNKRLSQAGSRLQLARQKREEAEQLARGLARQNVVASARGASPNSGSLMRQALAASRQSRQNVGFAAGRAALNDLDASNRARMATTASLLSFGTSVARHGPAVRNSLLRSQRSQTAIT